MPTKITYAVPTDDSGMAIRLGVAKGYFREAGIDLDVQTIFGGPELASALDRADVQIGQLGSPPAITAIAGGKKLRIIASSVEQGAAFFLLARPDIRDWSDFKGKTAGVLSKGSCGDWFLRQIFSQKGIDPDEDVGFLELRDDYGRQVELLRAGEIDLILSTEPFCTLGEAEEVGRSWGSVTDLGDVPAIQWIVEVANTGFVEKDAPLVDAILAAIERSARYALTHKEEWADFWADYFTISSAVARRSIERLTPFLHDSRALDFSGLANAIDIQYRLGAAEVRPAVSDIVDLRFQPEASRAGL